MWWSFLNLLSCTTQWCLLTQTFFTAHSLRLAWNAHDLHEPILSLCVERMISLDANIHRRTVEVDGGMHQAEESSRVLDEMAAKLDHLMLSCFEFLRKCCFNSTSRPSMLPEHMQSVCAGASLLLPSSVSYTVECWPCD